MTRRSRPSIHVAAMPFPSPQGTQASIAAMLQALADRGDATELWTYAHGDPRVHAAEPRYRVRRLWDVPRDRSLRSGPSFNKVLLDLQLAAQLALAAPASVVAHHVEAASAAWLAGRRFVFFAHTDLGGELPLYTPRLSATWLGALGTRLDRQLGHAAHAVAAISPRLAHMLERSLERPIRYVPTPWTHQRTTNATQRAQARHELDLDARREVLLYAGNLDPYQGWETLLHALVQIRRARDEALLLVATASDPEPLQHEAQRAGIAHALRITGLSDGRERERCHDAADLCLIPRRSEGGLPIKLLDALARSVPVIAAQRATAGLPLQRAAQIVADDSADAIAAAAVDLLDQRVAQDALRAAGSVYLREHHSHAKFFAALDPLLPT